MKVFRGWAHAKGSFRRIIKCGGNATLMSLLYLSTFGIKAQEVGTINYQSHANLNRNAQPLGDATFGEYASMEDGRTTFSVVDVRVESNADIPVQFGRTLNVRGTEALDFFYKEYTNTPERILGADWDADLPYMAGNFRAGNGWVPNTPTASTAPRCSAGTFSRSHEKSGMFTVQAHNWFQGIEINIPGYGRETLLTPQPGAVMPTDGKIYVGVTRSNWRVSCLPSIKNGGGEGFVVTLPDGVQYSFDWFSSRRIGFVPHNMDALFYVDKYRMYGTRAQDRFGNSVDYLYDTAQPDRILSISASDGARLGFYYSESDGLLSSISDGERSWTYQIQKGKLEQVILPDGSRWRYQGSPALKWVSALGSCEFSRGSWTTSKSPRNEETATFTVTHPSGAEATYRFRPIMFGYNRTPGKCQPGWSYRPKAYIGAALYSKTVSGLGMEERSWRIHYDPTWSYERECAGGCQNTATTTVYESNGTTTSYVFGNDFQTNASQLLSKTISSEAGTALVEHYQYLDTAIGQPFADHLGKGQYEVHPLPNSYLNRPLKAKTVSLDGVDFSWAVHGYDNFANAEVVRKWSSMGYSKIDVTEYHHDLAKWVLNQPKIEYNANTQQASLHIDFDANARPWKIYRFGKLQQELKYYGSGQLWLLINGRSQGTLFEQWHRGIPRLIHHPDGTSQSASVTDAGWITSVADEEGASTGYGYDAMGRIAGITYPINDVMAWNPAYQDFRPLSADDWLPPGISVGQWRQFTKEGSYVKVIYFDALWRPVLLMEYDADNVHSTARSIRTAYDSSGRKVFQSYPVAGVGPTSLGTHFSYDPLDRLTRSEQDSEHGRLVTTVTHLPGFRRQVINPNRHTTTTSFLAWDQPTTDLPAHIAHPEGAITTIARDIFGEPITLTRRNESGSVAATRHFVYNSYHQLCKTIEPETGVSVTTYDLAGNVDWTATGQNLNHIDCNDIGAVPMGQRVTRTYDARNRIETLDFPDRNGSQTFEYHADGKPKAIVTHNDGGATSVINRYDYNKRGLLTAESSMQTGIYGGFIRYDYNASGVLTQQNYPNGFSVDYAPNGLGQPTQAGPFANGVSYHPNGAIKRFTYGNGIVHSMEQNARQLPQRVSSDRGVFDLRYFYDGNANVAGVHDLLRTGPWSPLDKTMTYDGLDRLLSAGSGSFGSAGPGADHWQYFSYDVLDNISSMKHAGAKDYAQYVYDGNNRLQDIRNITNAMVVTLEYDVRGNLSRKNGQSYEFDFGNRLRAVSNKEAYRYDALGRRVSAFAPGKGMIRSMYSQSGQLLYEHNDRDGKGTDHVYLGGSLLAKIDRNWIAGTSVVTYQHTDALGSPVAASNWAGQVSASARTDWEPYGAAIGKVQPIQGTGYTGHVMDSATGLTYMQQRYYDPQIGRFLSVDPVTPYQKPITNFNRYVYALNNPYKFTDPDGREIKSINPANNQKIEGYVNSQAAGEFKFNDSNKLERVGDGAGSGSQTYNDSLVQGIASDKTMLVAVQPTVGDVNVADHGNGLTGQVGDKIAVVINDQPLSTVDAAGASLVDSPATILAHEIAGHAVPQMTGQPDANAVGIDNQIRSELGTPQIPADSTHKAYDPP